jgi:hypothetical protein
MISETPESGYLLDGHLAGQLDLCSRTTDVQIKLAGG